MLKNKFLFRIITTFIVASMKRNTENNHFSKNGRADWIEVFCVSVLLLREPMYCVGFVTMMFADLVLYWDYSLTT